MSKNQRQKHAWAPGEDYLVMRTAAAEDLFGGVYLKFDAEFNLIGHEEIKGDSKLDVRTGDIWCPLDVYGSNWERSFPEPRARAAAILADLEKFLNERLRHVGRFLRDYSIGQIRISIVEKRPRRRAGQPRAQRRSPRAR